MEPVGSTPLGRIKDFWVVNLQNSSCYGSMPSTMSEPVTRSFRPPDGSYFLFGPAGNRQDDAPSRRHCIPQRRRRALVPAHALRCGGRLRRRPRRAAARTIRGPLGPGGYVPPVARAVKLPAGPATDTQTTGHSRLPSAMTRSILRLPNRSFALPPPPHRVAMNFRIRGDEKSIVYDSGGDEEPVKGIPMMRRELR